MVSGHVYDPAASNPWGVILIRQPVLPECRPDNVLDTGYDIQPDAFAILNGFDVFGRCLEYLAGFMSAVADDSLCGGDLQIANKAVMSVQFVNKRVHHVLPDCRSLCGCKLLNSPVFQPNRGF